MAGNPGRDGRAIAMVLGVFLAACGGGGGGGGGGPDPTPTPVLAHTRLEVLRSGGLPRLSVTVDGVGGPVFLVGERAPLFFNAGDTQIAKIDTSTCTVLSRWQNVGQYLDTAKANSINLLHVELWNVWDGSPFPFVKDAAGKLRVQAAVEQGVWNDAYFAAVHELVQQASARGIVVLFSLFNHYNVRIEDASQGGRPWAAEPLRARNTDTGFGLDDDNGDWKRRTAEFLRAKDGAGNLTTIGRIQKALVERLLDELTEQNVIIEPLMVPWIVNNPNLTALSLPSWESWMISVIRAKEAALGRGVRSIIEVTPGPLTQEGPIVNGNVYNNWDIIEWKNAFRQSRTGYENWNQVDLIQYAGGFAFGDPPYQDPVNAIARERMLNHRRLFPEAALLYSTDGFNHRHAPDRCNAALGEYVQDVRHGWWDNVDLGVDLSQYPLFWAKATHNQIGDVPPGSIHFLNWTSAETSMEDLAKGHF